MSKDYSLAPADIDTLRQAGVSAVRISEVEPGLEDIFVQTMGRQEG